MVDEEARAYQAFLELWTNIQVAFIQCTRRANLLPTSLETLLVLHVQKLYSLFYLFLSGVCFEYGKRQEETDD